MASVFSTFDVQNITVATTEAVTAFLQSVDWKTLPQTAADSVAAFVANPSQVLNQENFNRVAEGPVGHAYHWLSAHPPLLPLVACYLALLLWYWTYLLVNKLRNAPPIETGLFPVLGAMFRFGRRLPLVFIKDCFEKYGNVFTIHVGGQHMTFLFDPNDFDTFFSKDQGVSFTEATLPFLDKGFGISKDSYFTHHHPILNRVREHMVPKCLAVRYCEDLASGLQEFFKKNWGDSGEGQLLERMRQCIFQCSTYLLFDPSMHDADMHDVQEIFEKYDDWFEIASSPLPLLCLPNFVRYKRSLRTALAEVLERRKRAGRMKTVKGDESAPSANDGRSLAEEISVSYEMHNNGSNEGIAGWLLSTLWAAEANSIIAVFWAISYLMQHPECLAKAQKEVVEVARESRNNGRFSYAELQRMTYLKACVSETVRLRPSGIIVRKTVAPVPFGKFTVPAGHMLCLSPYWYHRDEKMYPRPTEFIPDRWIEGEKGVPNPLMKSSKYSFISFGAGEYRCPGRYFGEMEMTLAVAALLYRYDIKMLDAAMPAPRMDRLVGIPPPLKDLKFSFKKRPAV